MQVIHEFVNNYWCISRGGSCHGHVKAQVLVLIVDQHEHSTEPTHYDRYGYTAACENMCAVTIKANTACSQLDIRIQTLKTFNIC